MAKIAYSYIRFSTKKQVTDSSIAVQMDRVEEYAKEHGYTLSDKSYKDLGVSAFKGKNVKEGELALFLEAVRTGAVEPDATLIIENLDRISRAHPWEALPVFMNIVNSGVTIVTLADRQVYTRKDVEGRNGMMAIFGSLMVLVRAHEESETKSDRAKKGIKKQVTAGIKVGRPPFWLKRTEDKRDFVIDEEMANLVREAFRLRLAGVGSLRIAQRLFNSNGFEWGSPQVARLLQNPAVIGTKVSQVGHPPILDYYRPILDQPTFYEVQKLVLKPGASNRGRKPEDVPNLFTGLARCCFCKRPLQFFRETKTVKERYLSCRKALSKSCKGVGFVNYTAFEEDVIQVLMKDPAEGVIEIMQQSARKMNVAEATTKTLTDQRERLYELARMGLGESSSLIEQIGRLDKQIAAVERTVTVLVEPVPDAATYAARAKALVRRYEETRTAKDKTEFYAVRQELKTAFAVSVAGLELMPEFRIADEVHGTYLIRLRKHEDIPISRNYTRPALVNVKGSMNGWTTAS